MAMEAIKPNEGTGEAGHKHPLQGVKSFAEIRKEGFVPYSLGPLYTSLGITHSLPGAFSDEYWLRRNKRPLGSMITLGRAVLQDCGEWDNLIELMDFESYRVFVNWMGTLGFNVEAEQVVYSVRRHMAPVLDPLWQQITVPPNEVLDVFCPVSSVKGLRPKVSYVSGVAPVVIEFERQPGDPSLLLTSMVWEDQ